jgi:hypothetical protein
MERLQLILKPILRKNTCDLWDDSRIKPGTKWRDEIEKAIQKAKVAILLISIDFLASDFIVDHELFPILERAEARDLQILWIPLGRCLYKESAIGAYQAAWAPDKPLNSLKPPELEKAWIQIAQLIQRALCGPICHKDQQSELSFRCPEFSESNVPFIINRDTQLPPEKEEVITFPWHQRVIENALLHPKFYARSVRVLAKLTGLSSSDIVFYCEESSHIALSPYRGNHGEKYYGILAKLRYKYPKL